MADFPEMTDAHWRSMEARWISMDLTDDADELIDTTAYLTERRKFREQSIEWLIKENQKKELEEFFKSLLTVWRQKRDEKKMSTEDKGSILRFAPKCDAITSPTQTATSSNSTDMPTQTSQFPPSPISRSSSANDIWNDVTILPSSPSPVKLPPVSVPLPLSSKLPSSVPKPSSASKPQNPKTTQSPSLSKPQKPAPSLHRTIKDSTPALTPLVKKNLKKTLNPIPRPPKQVTPHTKPHVPTSMQRPNTNKPSHPRECQGRERGKRRGRGGRNLFKEKSCCCWC
ncbi:hypothetical protein BC829DRAFT_398871 [Chytridium lagenaria]|nr:hypothetical protein BC829DRAFT_398871 [Chytridium lagenaria]